MLDEEDFTFALAPDVARYLRGDIGLVVAWNRWWGDVIVRFDQAGCC